MLADAPPLQVSIRVPRDALDLPEADAILYAALGYFTAQCADLEFLLDSFIFRYGKSRTPLVTQMSVFPLKMEQKIDFVIAAYIENRALRSCGDADDRIDLNSIGYLMEEVWDSRKHLIHGRLDFSRHDEASFSFQSTRYVRMSRSNYGETTYSISRSAILYLLDSISYLKAFLRNGLAILDGRSPKRKFDEIKKNRAEFRELRQSLLEEGIEIDPDGLLRFFSGGER